MPVNMISSNTRATRSRFSSPQIAASNGTTDPAKGTTTAASTIRSDGQRTLKDWLEPPLNAKASYQDAGLMKHGVVENMAPLGTLPKVGIFKKATVPSPAPAHEHKTPIRKIVLKRRSPATPPVPAATAASAAAPVAAAAAATAAPAPEEDETEEEEEEDEEEDGLILDDRRGYRDYDLDESGRPALTRRSLQSRDELDDEWAPGKSSYRGYSRRSTSRASAGRLGSISSSSYQQVPPSAPSRLADLRELADQVIEKAVDLAIAEYRYPTAWALRTLYDEKFEDASFLALVARIFHQTASPADLEEFGDLMRPRKKEGKKDNKACYYFIPPQTNNRFRPHQPKPSPYGHLIKLDLTPLRRDPESKAQPPPSPSQSQPQGYQEPQEREEPLEAPSEAETQPELASPPAPEPEPEVAPAPEEVTPPENVPQLARVAKRPLPEEDAQPDAEAEPERAPEPEPHARKKRRSNRHSTSASKMTGNGVNGKAKNATPSRRRTRANSHSSTSSLSSARSMTPPARVPEEHANADAYEVPPSRASPAAAETATKQTTKKGRRKSAAPRKGAKANNASSEPPASKASTPVATQPGAGSKQPTPAPQPDAAASETLVAEQPYDMPAVVDSPLFPNLNAKKGNKSGTNGVEFPSKIGKIDENDPKLRLRQSARAVTKRSEKAIEQSFTRNTAASGQEAAAATTPARRSRSRTSLPASRPNQAAATTTATTRSTRSARKRSHDELEEAASPTTVNFATSEVAPSTAANSRAGTPALRAVKKPRVGLRVKNSPMKKKSGTSAGIPRASGERASPGAVASREDDNDDYCASCGGNGELICCDGCTRSFHFVCVDPVLYEDAMPVEWYCNVCRTSRDPAAFPEHTGAFALLSEKLDAKNSSAFRLPDHVRNLFEGVRAGVDGEYEDIVNVPKVAKKKKSDEDAIADLFRLRDADGNAIICHGCQKSSSSNRAIIPCSLCGLFWHLDCLDPPLANPPNLRTWKCPCHIEEVVAKVPGTLGPAHRHRKIKSGSVIRPAFSRGFVNNGYIEIAPEDSDDESGWKNVETYGRTVRLPEKGIKLDFLSRVRENRKGKRIPPLAHALRSPASPTPALLDKETLEHQQAAHNLARLSGRGTAPFDQLIDVMVAEAEPSVVSMMARASSERLAANQALNRADQQSLRAMLAQLDQTRDRIQQLLCPGTPEQSSPQPATGSSSATQAQNIRVPSLTHSQTTDAESENPNLEGQTPGAVVLDAVDSAKDKNLPSPAATDEVLPQQTDEDKTLTPSKETGTSPLPAGESVVDEDKMPITPTVKIEDGGMDLD